jgi:isopentenyl-diphosphate delta-isomerase
VLRYVYLEVKTNIHMQESLILVDQFGHRTGVADRDVCHQGMGIRHRAFVIFLLRDDGKLLVQKRARSKLGGDCWDVSATSHVRLNETYDAAINRCLNHELGITASTRPRYQLAYNYRQKIGMHAEYEYCSLFLVYFNGQVNENTEEMEEVRWVSCEGLRSWFESDAQQFTPWFAEAFRRMTCRPPERIRGRSD